jgi:type IV secretion system protein VirB9
MRRRLLSAALALAFLTLAASAHAQPTREITYNARSVARIDTRLRMTTLVILPDGEEILDFVCGDKDYWVVSGAQNLAYIKPAKAGATTNLNLVTASGRVYSFLLAEGAADPDLKVFVVPDPSEPATPRPSRSSAVDADALNRQLSEARAEVDAAKRDAEESKHAAAREAEESIDKFKAGYPLQIQFPYAFKPRSKPFRVSAIYHDSRFTYIRLDSSELPAVYEVVDHVPNLVSFQAEHDTLIVPKVLEHGYLAIGKQRLPFDVVSK